jgi:hypothetical protein
MARFADIRRANRKPVAPVEETITIKTRITLYGEGINEGTLRAYPGDTLNYDHTTGAAWIDTADGIRYSTRLHTI